MPRRLLLLLFVVVETSLCAMCTDARSCIRESYPQPIGATPSSSLPASQEAGALFSLLASLQDLRGLKRAEGDTKAAVSQYGAVLKAEINPTSRSTAALVKCKTVKSLHGDLLNLSIRKSLVYSESKLMDLQEYFSKINSHALKEMEKDVFRK